MYIFIAIYTYIYKGQEEENHNLDVKHEPQTTNPKPLSRIPGEKILDHSGLAAIWHEERECTRSEMERGSIEMLADAGTNIRIGSSCSSCLFRDSGS